FNFPLFNMYGVNFVRYDDAGMAVAALNDANGEEALAVLQRIANSPVEGKAWQRSALSPDAGFLNKRYAMILTGPWNVENFTNAGLDFDIALIPRPSDEQIE